MGQSNAESVSDLVHSNLKPSADQVCEVGVGVGERVGGCGCACKSVGVWCPRAWQQSDSLWCVELWAL